MNLRGNYIQLMANNITTESDEGREGEREERREGGKERERKGEREERREGGTGRKREGRREGGKERGRNKQHTQFPRPENEMSCM